MADKGRVSKPAVKGTLQKVLTGVDGLDDVTFGGLPRGRTTLIYGGTGSGKTVLAMGFVANGAVLFDEPGVYMCFEENRGDLIKNFESMGYDLKKLIADKKLIIDTVRIESSEFDEAGKYDLEGLFIRLNHAIDSIGAKRVVLDTIETLFFNLPDSGIVRSELSRLFNWLKDKGITTVVTGERSEGILTRQGLWEYVADCVLLLDNRMHEQESTRRLRILKYRGSSHDSGEFPFLIDKHGVSVVPITMLRLEYKVPKDRISSGIPRLDTMLGGKGFFRASSILITGTAGSGKTSVAASFVDAACRRGERCLFFAFEESPDQIARNMSSIGIDLDSHIRKGLLKFHAERPSIYGLETHLLNIKKWTQEFRPKVVVVDPITNLGSLGTGREITAMLSRLVDSFKSEGISAMFTSLTRGEDSLDTSSANVSSLMDTWIILKDVESSGESNRIISLVKSRGMQHSNQVREFIITDEGINLLDVYFGMAGVLTGSARMVQEAEERANAIVREQEMERKRLEVDRKRKAVKAQAEVLELELEADEAEAMKVVRQEETRARELERMQKEMSSVRQADKKRSGKKGEKPGRGVK